MGKAKDICGQKFGLLTPVSLERAEPRTAGGTEHFWLFMCDCGNSIVTNKKSVTSGKTKSCGCLKKDGRNRIKNKLIGMTFGRWSVIKMAEPVYNEVRWTCVCKCGTIRDVSSQALTQGKSKSCGCSSVDINKAHSGSASWRWTGGKADKRCPVCGNIFHTYTGGVKEQVYCSLACANISKTGRRGHSWAGGPVKTQCNTCGRDIMRSKSQLKHYPISFCGKKCQGVWHKKRLSGNLHYRWDPNLDRESARSIRRSVEYKDWRRLVSKRDGFQCQSCGEYGKKPLHVHHLIGVANLRFTPQKHLIFDTDNGIVLCKDCHVKFHSLYGQKNNNEDQLWEFITETAFPQHDITTSTIKQ